MNKRKYLKDFQGCRFQEKCDFKVQVKMASKTKHTACIFPSTCNQKTDSLLQT